MMSIKEVMELFDNKAVVMGGAVADLHFNKEVKDYDMLIHAKDWCEFDNFPVFGGNVQYNAEFDTRYFGNYEIPSMISRSLNFNIDDTEIDVFILDYSYEDYDINSLVERYIVENFDQAIKMAYYGVNGAKYAPEFHRAIKINTNTLTTRGEKDLNADRYQFESSRIIQRLENTKKKYGIPYDMYQVMNVVDKVNKSTMLT